MRPPISTAWGKLDRGESGDWHPLIDHCADVAATFVRILQASSLGTRLDRLAGRPLTEVDRARLTVLCALHDIGKCNRGFQQMACGGAKCGHVREALHPLCADASASAHGPRIRAALGDVFAHWDPELNLLSAAICHHGFPAPDSGTRIDHNWGATTDYDPYTALSELVDATRQWLPSAWSDAPPLPSPPAFEHAFVGLVSLADWVGSDTRFFPYSQPGDPSRFTTSLDRAAEALAAIGLDPTPAQLGRPPVFEDISEYPPYPMQSATLALPTVDPGSLVILEAETGSGKTEAAVARFMSLRHAGQVDGMYFAVPTRTAATQLHERLHSAMKRAFGDVVPPVSLAVPGYLRVDDLHGKHLPGFEVLWDDQPRRDRGWSVENPKRYFAGGVVVGTIDQVLLSALRVKHAPLRATGLLRLLLVIDEVHASDTYMTEIALSALEFQLGAGGHAMLMSATLGAAARHRYEKLVRPERRLPDLAEAIDTPYPRLTAGAEPAPFAESKARTKTVHWSVQPWALKEIADDDPLTDAVARDVAAGARILIIRNTVSAARDTQERLESRGVPTLECNGHPVAHHSRFARPDRALLDHAVETQLGKDAARTSGLACVATQTCEQSLDLDADLLLTDLCPVDVLLQRIGRLHRHDRARPDGFEAARCIVLVPPGLDLESYIQKGGHGSGPFGLGPVYSDLSILDATLGLIRARAAIDIPEHNRELVERATHPEVLAGWSTKSDAWKRHATHCRGGALAEARTADLSVLKRTALYLHADNAHDKDIRIPTRLGADDRILELPTQVQSPFGCSVRKLTVPGHAANRLELSTDPDDIVISDQTAAGFTFRAGPVEFTYTRRGLEWP